MISSEQINFGPPEMGYSAWWWMSILMDKIETDLIYNPIH